MSATLLSLQEVSRIYGREPAVHALRDVSFNVRSGEAIAVIGRSGSGKSTLLNVLGLLDTTSSGNYRVADCAIEDLPEHERTQLRATFFGFVFQQSFLLAHRTARENVEVPLRLQGVSSRERHGRASDALTAVGLANRERFLPRALSGGECQRVAIARALVHRPKVLLCDEPTGNLDEHTAAEVLERLLEANGLGVTLITVTHDVAMAKAFPRVISVRDGHVSEGAQGFLDSESVGFAALVDRKREQTHEPK